MELPGFPDQARAAKASFLDPRVNYLSPGTSLVLHVLLVIVGVGFPLGGLVSDGHLTRAAISNTGGGSEGTLATLALGIASLVVALVVVEPKQWRTLLEEHASLAQVTAEERRSNVVFGVLTGMGIVSGALAGVAIVVAVGTPEIAPIATAVVLTVVWVVIAILPAVTRQSGAGLLVEYANSLQGLIAVTEISLGTAGQPGECPCGCEGCCCGRRKRRTTFVDPAAPLEAADATSAVDRAVARWTTWPAAVLVVLAVIVLVLARGEGLAIVAAVLCCAIGVSFEFRARLCLARRAVFDGVTFTVIAVLLGLGSGIGAGLAAAPEPVRVVIVGVLAAGASLALSLGAVSYFWRHGALGTRHLRRLVLNELLCKTADAAQRFLDFETMFGSTNRSDSAMQDQADNTADANVERTLRQLHAEIWAELDSDSAREAARTALEAVNEVRRRRYSSCC